MEEILTMKDLPPGQTASVRSLNTTGPMRRRLLDIGLTAGTDVTCLGRSPGGDPSAFLIRGAVIALRQNDCAGITLQAGKRGT